MIENSIARVSEDNVNKEEIINYANKSNVTFNQNLKLVDQIDNEKLNTDLLTPLEDELAKQRYIT